MLEDLSKVAEGVGAVADKGISNGGRSRNVEDLPQRKGLRFVGVVHHSSKWTL